jgi:hypothetical protein
MKANNGECNPKNIIDHNVFKASCIQKKFNADLCLLNPLSHIKYKEIPIKTNKVIQTGPNIQLGGLNTGFINVAYHVRIEGVVKIEPIIPAS